MIPWEYFASTEASYLTRKQGRVIIRSLFNLAKSILQQIFKMIFFTKTVNLKKIVLKIHTTLLLFLKLQPIHFLFKTFLTLPIKMVNRHYDKVKLRRISTYLYHFFSDSVNFKNRNWQKLNSKNLAWSQCFLNVRKWKENILQSVGLNEAMSGVIAKFIRRRNMFIIIPNMFLIFIHHQKLNNLFSEDNLILNYISDSHNTWWIGFNKNIGATMDKFSEINQHSRT